MALSIADLITRAKALADKRLDASIPDTDWLVYVSWAQSSLYRLIVSIDPGAYFQTIDFTLVGGVGQNAFNLDPYFDVRLIATSLPAFTASLGPGPGRALQANANGILTVDGVTPVVGDRILYAIFGTSPGIYTVVSPGTAGTPWALIRATDFDQLGPNEVQIGAVVQASAGTALSGTPFVLTALTGAPDVGQQTWTNIPLYTRFRALHGVDIYPDTNNRRTVRTRNFRERSMRAIGWWMPTAFDADRQYDLRGRILYVTPYELAGATYRAYYRAAPYQWSTPTDTDRMDPQLEEYDEWVVIRAAMKALKIEESDANPWREELELLREEIMSSHQRDDGEAQRIADIESDDNWWGP